jgi:hypothetical protein
VGFVTVALLFLLFLLALIPVGRLWRAGVPLSWRVTYLIVLLLAGLVTIEGRALARYLLPLTLLVYLLPFTRLPQAYMRWRSAPRRRGRGDDRDEGQAGQSAATRGRGRDRGKDVIEGTAVRLDPDGQPPESTA